MQFCYELNDRQSARVFEMAIRDEATIRLDPHYTTGLESFAVQLAEATDEYLVFRILEGQDGAGGGLVPGQYCQAQFTLGPSIYLLSVYVIDLNEQEQTLRTARPKSMQILERRRFARARVANTSTVTIRWPETDRQAEGPLFNIGGGGLAFRVDKQAGDAMLVGDVVEAEFELPGLARRYAFQVVICNKTVTSDEQSVIVGVQFRDSEETGQAGDLDELRRFLASQQQASFAR